MPGQHRSESKSYGATITTIIVIILVIAAIVWWLFYHKDDSAETTQAEGCENTVVLPVAEQYPGAADMFLRDFSAECVTPELVDSPAQAALYVGMDTPATDALLAEQGRSRIPGQAQTVGSTPVGLSTPQPDTTEVDPQAVFYGPDPAVAHAAALALTQDPAAAQALTSRDAQAPAPEDPAVPLAVTATTNPEGRSFTPLPDAELTFAAIALSPQEGISQEAIDAATAAAYPAAPEQAEQQEAAAQTLFLLDTSERMAPQIDAARAALTAEAQATGQPVALWNYSSPLNPGVTRPWRDNVPFGPAEEITPVLQGFGTDGIPLTRTSVLAALRTAAEQAQATGQPTRVVLFTSGTAPEDLDDAAFGRQLASALENPQVSLEVVQVGDQVDQVLSEQADATRNL
ncbi:VWA domain-containing protein [Corynebacterium sp. 21KM1197]|uniref:VWA domain-containing protein n=1 Tax=Corynebacterium sp. 21KM1197 TaxID=2989734 RepID=UPI0029CA7A2B|nr:VWA domain-containing protein [Corynebacterium sp. 21KM1197]WPF69638.1 VWA domain-containing protein [Corynebacterium sp. 21KM1197]